MDVPWYEFEFVSTFEIETIGFLMKFESWHWKERNIINKLEVKKSIKIAEKLIKGNGRILVRKSGTESKIRVMGESENKIILSKCINIISQKIK